MMSLLCQLSDAAPSWIAPLLNVGAVAVCLIALSLYYMAKDKRYEQRIDERLVAEAQFRKEQAELTEKYRLALEKFGTTLDSVLRILPKRHGEDR